MKKVVKKTVLIILTIIAIYNIIYFVLGKHDIAFFGMRFYILESNAMKPDIEEKDVIIFKKAKEKKIKQDDIILYKNGANIRVGRIIQINENYGKTSYVVKADNRYFNDTEQLLIENVQGRMIKKVENGAWILKICRSKILTVFIFVALFFVYRLKQYKKQLLKKRKKRNNKLNVKNK